jgi:mRNA interferase MazF
VIITAQRILDANPSVVQVVPLTSAIRRSHSEALIEPDQGDGLDAMSAAQCQHLRAVSPGRVVAAHGNVGATALTRVCETIAGIRVTPTVGCGNRTGPSKVGRSMVLALLLKPSRKRRGGGNVLRSGVVMPGGVGVLALAAHVGGALTRRSSFSTATARGHPLRRTSGPLAVRPVGRR